MREQARPVESFQVRKHLNQFRTSAGSLPVVITGTKYRDSNGSRRQRVCCRCDVCVSRRDFFCPKEAQAPSAMMLGWGEMQTLDSRAAFPGGAGFFTSDAPEALQGTDASFVQRFQITRSMHVHFHAGDDSTCEPICSVPDTKGTVP